MTTAHSAFKVFKRRKDGSLGPLFINARQRIPLGEWLPAEAHRTKGFAYRPGWHVTAEQSAPHLRTTGPDRVWARVEVRGIVKFTRPLAQGGLWYLAQEMRVVEVLAA